MVEAQFFQLNLEQMPEDGLLKIVHTLTLANFLFDGEVNGVSIVCSGYFGKSAAKRLQTALVISNNIFSRYTSMQYMVWSITRTVRSNQGMPVSKDV